ncbi:MAG: hypothetical protein KF832_07165 [Caldilineaceae bacterium]|nr:hypothetical protein [Caldilineaceae bacterium]
MFTVVMELVQRTRQHHAIEHATLHVLAARYPSRRFSGYSDPLGFTIAGNLDETALRHAVGDALLRLQAGESSLALHPNCGTNLVTSATLVALVALITGSKRNPVERFITTLIGVIPVMLFAKQIGFFLQSYTTAADVSDRWVAEIRPLTIGTLHAHRVLFE